MYLLNLPKFFFVDTADALIVSCGYQTVHVLPVLGGRMDTQYTRRINIGGFHGDTFMQRLLQLKYPGHLNALTLSRAEVIIYTIKTILI